MMENMQTGTRVSSGGDGSLFCGLNVVAVHMEKASMRGGKLKTCHVRKGEDEDSEYSAVHGWSGCPPYLREGCRRGEFVGEDFFVSQAH